MKKGRRMLAFLMLFSALLTAALSGCSGDRADIAPNGDTPDDKLAINVGLAKDLGDSLDPHKMTSAGTKEVLFNVFEGLVKPDSDGNLIPAIAESYTISDDGLTYTFTLRDGVKFHNGKTVTADDVVYSLKRCAGLLEEEPEPLMSAFSAVTDVQAGDDGTVLLTIAARNLEFISYLTAGIIPSDYTTQETAPVGTGPFKFVSRSAQENVVLTRFDDYWGELPALTDVTFKIVTSDTIVTSLLSGAIDMCAHLSPTQAEQVVPAFDVTQGGMNTVLGVYLNNEVEPLTNPDVRRALSHAVNVDDIMTLAFSGKGTKLGSSMYPAFGKYFDDSLTGYYEYSVDTAKQMLSDAGYPDGFDITLTVASNAQQYIDTAQVIAEQWKAVGVNVTIDLVDFETWISDVYGEHKYQATIMDFDASTMTANALLDRFNSDRPKNISGFKNAEYDAAYARAVAATTDEEQVAAYLECERILTEQAANIYLLDMPDMVALRKDLTGYEFYPIFVIDLAKIKPVNN
jgi:peptide/nickel transport system substrate-binding protein